MTPKLARILWTTVVVAGCGTGAPSAPAATVATAVTPAPSPTSAASHRLTGTFTLNDRPEIGANATCHGTGGYDDIREGLGVVVRDGAGVVLATSALGPGAYVDVARLYGCRFLFFVPDVPDAPFYAIEVGHRGELTYSKAELEAAGWSVAFTLGD